MHSWWVLGLLGAGRHAHACTSHPGQPPRGRPNHRTLGVSARHIMCINVPRWLWGGTGCVSALARPPTRRSQRARAPDTPLFLVPTHVLSAQRARPPHALWAARGYVWQRIPKRGGARGARGCVPLAPTHKFTAARAECTKCTKCHHAHPTWRAPMKRAPHPMKRGARRDTDPPHPIP